MREIRALIARMATENRGWGYTRIQGALANLKHEVSRGTIATVLREHGLEPEPDRLKKTTWAEFLKTQWGGPGRRGFLYGGRLDGLRAEAVRRALPHRTIHAPHSYRRHCVGARRRVDEPDEPQPDGWAPAVLNSKTHASVS